MSSISVVMSVYKAEKPAFLNLSMSSIWSEQAVKPDEIILIEDGPLGKDLLKVIENWRCIIGPRLKIIVNTDNIGLTKSLNKGIAIASSQYIARMDSDDISTPNRFKLQAEFLDNHNDVHVVGGSISEFNADNQNLGIRNFPRNNDSILKYIYKASPLAHPAVMMRKCIFDNGLTYNDNYRTSQDIALWFDVLKAGYKIANLNEIVLKFRRDGDVFKRRSRAKAKNEFKIYLNGIRSIYGLITWRYIFPIARFCFRMMPVSVVKFIYGTNLRTKLLQ